MGTENGSGVLHKLNLLASGDIDIRDAFRVWILFAALLAFLVAMAISFIAISISEHNRAEASVTSEVNYLCLQLESLNERVDAFSRISEAAGVTPDGPSPVDPDDWRLLTDPVGILLDGYTMGETGTVALIKNDTIIATDDPRLPLGSDVGELLGDDIAEAVETSVETAALQNILYDGVLATRDNANGQDYPVQPGYLLAGRQGGYTVMIIEPASLFYKSRTNIMLALTVLFLVLLSVVSFIVAKLLDIMVAGRVEKMNEALAKITSGDLDARVQAAGTKEFKSLSVGINQTVEALQGWIVEAETRMDTELAAAKAIQESALPRTFPPYPDIVKFDIHAMTDAAREVGGDFYDFFLLGDSGTESGRLAFLVADVSGKGVPAALFMMKAKTQIRDYLVSGMELGEAIENANRQLCQGNDSNMFVTAWIGVLDYETFRVDYVNAGHNPPLLWQRATGWRWLRERSGPMLGVFEDMPYTTCSLECHPEDQFLLYTDGVTEAFSVDDKLYGSERLLDVAEKNWRLHPRYLVEAVRADVAAYSKDAEQSDDITILSLEVGVPPEITTVLEVPARIEELQRVNDFLHEELDRRLCPQRVQNQLDIAVEELFTNVASYAYPDAGPNDPGPAWIQRTYSANPPSITVEIIDRGDAFNPLDRPDPVLPETVSNMPFGGLGILLAKKCVDEIRYERTDDGKNVVTIVKRW